jgi:hypothetical protein
VCLTAPNPWAKSVTQFSHSGMFVLESFPTHFRLGQTHSPVGTHAGKHWNYCSCGFNRQWNHNKSRWADRVTGLRQVLEDGHNQIN